MWQIKTKTEGQSACPRRSQHFRLDSIDKNRFAKWEMINTQLGLRIPLYIYLPKNPQNCRAAIISIHGKHRNAIKFRNIFVDQVQDENVMIISPRFDKKNFRGSWSLIMGNMHPNRKPEVTKPNDRWTFNIIDEIFKQAKLAYPSLEYYSIFGHSAGSQFAHRLAYFTSHKHLHSIVAANPGWFTLLDESQEPPYGIKDNPMVHDLEVILNKNVIILSGEQDTDQDEHVRKTDGALKQGQNRHERAKNYFNHLEELASDNNMDLNWSLVTDKYLGHSAKESAKLAYPYLIKDDHGKQ